MTSTTFTATDIPARVSREEFVAFIIADADTHTAIDQVEDRQVAEAIAEAKGWLVF